VCGRYTLATPDLLGVRARYGVDERVEVRRRFNVAPGDDVVAVTTDRRAQPDGEHAPAQSVGRMLRWGLVPHWAEDPRIGARMINARAEGIAERPAFRDAFASRRCLIAADGFYEWQRRPGAPKRAWWISRADGEPFAFAGLWATWRGAPGTLRSCAIVTTVASEAIAPLHDRMPVILPRDAEATWLDPATPRAELLDLLVPLDPAATALREVGDAVNDARHDAEDCLDPPPAGEALPATLF
jgi:putative SOS response-associated peptidase YedK